MSKLFKKISRGVWKKKVKMAIAEANEKELRQDFLKYKKLETAK